MSKTTKVPKIPKEIIDWERIEFHFRAGVRTLEDMGKEFGVSKGRISQVAKAKGWGRDLAAKIKVRADAKLQAHVAQQALNDEALNDPAKQAGRRLVETEIVEANVNMSVAVQVKHRGLINRTQGLFTTLLEELEVASSADGASLIEALVELVSPPDVDADPILERAAAARREKQLQRLLDGAGRIDSAKKLTDMLKVLIELERKAHNLDSAADGEGAYEATLRRVIEEANRG